MREEIRKFISDQFLVDFGSEINDDTDLFEAGVIDSFGFVELILFLKNKFGAQVSDEDLLSDSFTTVTKITEFIQRGQK